MSSSNSDANEAGPAAEGVSVDLIRERDIEIAATTHRGLFRDNNEDHYAIMRRHRSSQVMSTSLAGTEESDYEDSAWIIVVADGLGGQAAGEKASESAIRTIIRLSNEMSTWIMRPSNRPGEDLAERAKIYANEIQKELQLQAAFSPELSGMGTTLTCMYVMGREAVAINVGDSRTYLARGKDFLQVTRDHTVAQELQDLGNPPESVRSFEHVLTRSFSTDGEPVNLDLCHITLREGDYILLCSDGLSDMVDDRTMHSIIEASPSAESGCEALLRAALQAGGRDNVTILLGQIR